MMFKIFVETSCTLETINLKALAASGDSFNITTTSSTVMMFKSSIMNRREKAVEANKITLLSVKKEIRSVIDLRKFEIFMKPLKESKFLKFDN